MSSANPVVADASLRCTRKVDPAKTARGSKPRKTCGKIGHRVLISGQLTEVEDVVCYGHAMALRRKGFVVRNLSEEKPVDAVEARRV